MLICVYTKCSQTKPIRSVGMVTYTPDTISYQWSQNDIDWRFLCGPLVFSLQKLGGFVLRGSKAFLTSPTTDSHIFKVLKTLMLLQPKNRFSQTWWKFESKCKDLAVFPIQYISLPISILPSLCIMASPISVHRPMNHSLCTVQLCF